MILERISCRGNVEMSMPSMVMVPPVSSTIRKMDRTKELLPLETRGRVNELQACQSSVTSILPSCSSADADLLAGFNRERHLLQYRLGNPERHECQWGGDTQEAVCLLVARRN